MSDNTMSTAASSSALSAQQAPAAGPQHDFASDTELVMAAIARMEAAVRGERATHERLRAELDSMAEAIAHVKTSVRNAASSGKPVNVLVLLTWLEARVHGMRGYLGQPRMDPAAQPQEATAEPAMDAAQSASAEAPAASHEAVPTVSDVVSRLGRASEALEQEAHALEQTASAGDVPTVSMLGAMVEALTAPESATTEAKAEFEAPAPVVEQTVAEQPEAEPATAVFEVTPEAVVAEASAAETNITELEVIETVADDPAPEVSTFAEELGAAEPIAAETEAAVANEAEIVQPEALLAETIIANEPATDAIRESAVEADPDAEATAFLSEPTAIHEIALPEALAQETVAEATPDIVAAGTTETDTVAVAESTAAEATHEPSAHEFELLTRFAAMEAIPFMRDDVGTAVIFEPKAEFDAAAEQMVFETPARPVETEAAASVESHHQAAPDVQPELAIAAQEPAAAAAPSNHAVYAGASSLPVSPAVIGSIAALTDTSEPEAGAADASEATTPIEAADAEIKIEFFDIDEPETKAEAATTASDVIAESALDVIVAEPAPAELGELVVAENDEMAASETSVAAIETVLTAATETPAATAMLEPEAKAEFAESVQAPTETVIVQIAETAVEPVAASTEAERTALAQAIAEMTAKVAAKSATTSGAETQGEPAPAASVEATTTSAPPAAETPDAADDDLSDLFAPEPDAALDPNNVLLGLPPAPAYTLDPATAAVLPMHDMALSQAAHPASPAEAPQPEAAKSPAAGQSHDPLALLKVMSDEEKIALFS